MFQPSIYTLLAAAYLERSENRVEFMEPCKFLFVVLYKRIQSQQLILGQIYPGFLSLAKPQNCREVVTVYFQTMNRHLYPIFPSLYIVDRP